MAGLDDLGKKLKELRNNRDLTMDMVVFDVGRTYNVEFTKGNLSRWENGINYPSLIYAAALAKYYGVSVDYLIGNSDVSTPPDLLAQNRRNRNGKS